jgi:hypothetical protein
MYWFSLFNENKLILIIVCFMVLITFISLLFYSVDDDDDEMNCIFGVLIPCSLFSCFYFLRSVCSWISYVVSKWQFAETCSNSNSYQSHNYLKKATILPWVAVTACLRLRFHLCNYAAWGMPVRKKTVKRSDGNMHQQPANTRTYLPVWVRAGDMCYLASTPCAPILRMPLLLHTVAPTHATNACVTLHA